MGNIYLENQYNAKTKITRQQLSILLKQDSNRLLSDEFDSASNHIKNMPHQDSLENNFEMPRASKGSVFSKTCNICNAAVDITLQRGTPLSPMLDIDDVLSRDKYGGDCGMIPLVHRICFQLRDAEANNLDIVLSQNPLPQSREW